MNLTWIDWAIVAAYFLLSAGIGLRVHEDAAARA